jgi:hypothetical protein
MRRLVTSGYLIAAAVGACCAQQVGDTIYLNTSSPLAPDGFAQVGVLETVGLLDGGGKGYGFSITGENNPLLKPLLPDTGITVSITVLDGKPYKVVDASEKFAGCSWLSGVSSTFAFIGGMEFYFPILPGGEAYVKDDRYTVRLNDTIGVSCVMDARGVFHGTFTKYADASDRKGTPLELGDPLLITASADNPFRFAEVRAHSALNGLTNMDLTCCGRGYYALGITDYRSVPTLVEFGTVPRRLRPTGSSERMMLYDIAGRRFGGAVRARMRVSVDAAGRRRIISGSVR